MTAHRVWRAQVRILFVLLAIGVSANAAALPPGFQQTLVTGGLSNPTAMQFAPDGRLFVCEQTGQLRVIKNGTLLSTPFLSLTVNASGERGLLGVAFDPSFATNQFVYVYYTATTPAVHNRISRFTANGDVAVPGSELVLLDLNNLGATNHNGGALAFGHDGKLYAAVGENANGANAQTLSNLLGKILRINSDGTIPTDNPFYVSATGNNRAIWTLGLRNPFTFAFNPVGTELFINDVGENTWEEINNGIAGANYGWNITEGATTDPRFTTPIYTYNHAGGECAITGGAFYAPVTTQFPADYVRDYFFADFCGGWIRKLDTSTVTVVTFATGISAPVDLKVADDGSLYVLARGSGAVYRIDYAPSIPVITTQPSSQTVLSGTPVTFSVRASGTSPIRYQWQRNGADISGATAADYTIASPAASDDGARFRATVSNDFGSVLSNEALLTVTTVQGPTTATFLRTDTTTRGTWRGTYGNQGWALAGESNNLPTYAQLTLAGQSTWTWTGSTTDVRALQRPTSSDRFASTWYAGGSFTLDLALTDGSPHQVALYAVDWDTTSRVERIDVFNAATNALLDSRTLANFNNGQYLIWNVAGHIVFRVTLTGGVNAIVSGFFIDGNSGGGTSSAATFLRTDTTTRGTWRGTYGNQGWALAGDANSLPAYAQLTLASQSTWTWTGSTTDVRALQRPTGTDRFAATWYAAGSFALDLALTDGSPHQVALYAVDWDIRSRAERIDVLDAATNALLDSRPLANFDNGQYLVWTVTGHVVFRVTLTGGVNPVISGLFIDGSGGGGTSSAATFLRTDTTTGGTWRGAYGNQGWSLATESNTLPAYAQFTPVGQSVWTWAGSTTDVRALQRPTTSDRFAATWFAGSSFTLDLALTDGSPHQVALYAVDWDTTSRAERIDVLDAATSALLDSRTLASFNNGQYLVWTVAGHVVFRVTLTGGVNPIVSGLFLD